MPTLAIPLAAMLAVQIAISCMSMIAPVIAPLVAREQGFDPGLVGLYIALLYSVAALTSLMAGAAVHRYGPLRVSQGCLVIAGGAVALGAIGTGWAMVLSALAVGVAYGPSTPASTHILHRASPPERINLVFSIKQTGVPAGNMLAGAMMPTLALAAGWRVALLLVAAAAVLLAVAIQPLRAAFDAERDPRRPLLHLGHLAGIFRLIATQAPLRRLAIMSTCYGGMQNALGAFLVVYLNGELGLSLVQAGAMLSVAQAAGAVGRIVWGTIADRYASPRVVLAALGLGMSAAGLLAGAFTATWPVPLLGLVCLAFGATAVGWNGVFLAQVARESPAGRAGEVVGAVNFFTFGGFMAIPAVFTAIVSLAGSYAAGYAVAALFSGLGALLLLRRGAA